MARGTSRRQLLWGATSFGALWSVGCAPAAMAPDGTVPDEPDCLDPFAGGTFLEEVPFSDEPEQDYGTLQEQGWDARRVFDLSRLDTGAEVVASEDFFVRTAYPDQLETSDEDWRVRLYGRVEQEAAWTIDELRAAAVDIGEVLIECSGNSGNRRFGLMSAARWSGVPMSDVLDRSVAASDAAYVIVHGFDGHSVPSRNGHSTPGAAWAFPVEVLRAQGFLAVEMNGEPLLPDHGAPVRLLMPGWYGCCQIKWVEGVELVGPDTLSTGQMLEFASRTHQVGEPARVADYAPATMQRSAVPVRVEKWEVDGEIRYRVIGIAWGGEGPVQGLLFDDGERSEAVTLCSHGADHRTWTLWVHDWRPPRKGSYRLRMWMEDPGEPSVRLDLGWYERTVEIDQRSQ